MLEISQEGHTQRWKQWLRLRENGWLEDKKGEKKLFTAYSFEPFDFYTMSSYDL